MLRYMVRHDIRYVTSSGDILMRHEELQFFMKSAIPVTNDFERKLRDDQLKNDDMQREKEKEELKKNKGFVQMYERNIVYIRELIRENPLSAEIFLFLSEKMNTKNALVCPTQVLCEVFNKSRATIDRATKILRDHGYIFLTKAGQTSVYHLNPELVWKAWDSDKKYCEFQGNILISKSENQEIEVHWKKYKHLQVHVD